jgi:hypothetical protein
MEAVFAQHSLRMLVEFRLLVRVAQQIEDEVEK